MTGTQLKALRKLFMISISAAARFIGYVELATWHRWEKGTNKVPDYVAEEMISINETRQKHISGIIAGLNLEEVECSLSELDSVVSSLVELSFKLTSKHAAILTLDTIIAGVYAAILEKQGDGESLT